jgi:endonuclease YncB( thermonuclease family)
MKKRKLTFFISVLLLLCGSVSFAGKTKEDVPQDFHGVKFIKNYDGDTFTVNLRCRAKIFCKSMSVRIKGIDAPEIKGKTECEKNTALISKKFVYNALIKAKPLALTNCTKDKYFRINCDVIYNGDINLGELMLLKKLAVSYDGSTKQNTDWCKLYNKEEKINKP